MRGIPSSDRVAQAWRAGERRLVLGALRGDDLRAALVGAGLIVPAADEGLLTPVRLAPRSAVLRLDRTGRDAAAGRVALARAGQWDGGLDFEPERHLRSRRRT